MVIPMSQSATRLPPLSRSEWTDEAREVFGYWEGPTARENGSQSQTMMVLANHPRLAIASLDFGKYILVDCTLTARQKELIVLRVAWRYGSEYQWTHHVLSGRKIGMTDAEFDALKTAGDSPAFNRGEQAIIRAVDQLSDSGKVDDATWSALSEELDKHQLMDTLYAIGLFTMNAWALGAMGVEAEENSASFSKSAEEMVKNLG